MVKKRGGNWKFDKNVALRFQDEARGHIPNYEAVIRRCVEIVSAEFPNTQPKIIDVGSALGHTMEQFRNAGYINVWGVDNSDAMLKHSTVRENLVRSDSFPSEKGPFDVVIANWTLHFIEKGKRKTYLKDVHRSMNEGGIFVISDKMSGSTASQRGYIDFKRSMGLSETAIAKKTAAVEGILTPLPVQWYLESLDRIGFKNIEIIDALWRFNTILCRK